MPVTNPALPLYAAEIERTCLPLEQATMLPGAAYTDHVVLEWERANLFRRGWICAGHVDQVSERGHFLTVDVGGENVLVVGDDDGLPRAFLNTCRHRGARLAILPEGRIRRLQCPYHAWTYGFDGSLKNAPFTDGLTDFDPKCFSLHEVRLAVVEGLVLLDLSGEAPPPQEHIGDLASSLAAYRLPELKRGARIVYDVDANWKAIGENYSECLHCPGVHPGAQPALALPVGRDDRGLRPVVRRLDDARRGRREHDRRRRRAPASRSTASTSARSSTS